MDEGGAEAGAGGTAVGEGVAVGGQQLLITGAGSDGQGTIMMSAEDAAQFFQNAGIQWDPSGQGVIIGDASQVHDMTEATQDVRVVETFFERRIRVLMTLGVAAFLNYNLHD